MTTKRERQLVVEPDSHCQIRTVDGKVPDRNPLTSAAKVWATAGRIHYNLDLRFTSQSLAVAFTERPTIGGRAWPTVLFHDERHELRLRAMVQLHPRPDDPLVVVQQVASGPGNHHTHRAIRHFPTLDVRTLSDHQLAACEAAFNDLRDLRFLPFNQLHGGPRARGAGPAAACHRPGTTSIGNGGRRSATPPKAGQRAPNPRGEEVQDRVHGSGRGNSESRSMGPMTLRRQAEEITNRMAVKSLALTDLE